MNFTSVVCRFGCETKLISNIVMNYDLDPYNGSVYFCFIECVGGKENPCNGHGKCEVNLHLIKCNND